MASEHRPLFVAESGDHKFPEKFITPSPQLLDAILNSRLRDENYALVASLYLGYLEMFNDIDEKTKEGAMDRQIKTAIIHLHSLRSINGIANNLAAMTYDQIFFVEAAGMKLDKDQRKILAEMHAQRQQRLVNSRTSNDNGDGQSE